MKIVAGKFRGRELKTPPGQATRPTAARIRESMMDMVACARGGFEDAVVFDAFAGSGALGFESLSRGAQFVLFCECGKGALRVLRANIDMLGVTSAVVCLRAVDVLKDFCLCTPAPFDLVFLDPPYSYAPATVLPLLTYLRRLGVLADDALVVYEHSTATTDDLAEVVGIHHMMCIRHKTYGDTSIDILRSTPDTSNCAAKGNEEG